MMTAEPVQELSFVFPHIGKALRHPSSSGVSYVTRRVVLDSLLLLCS